MKTGRARAAGVIAALSLAVVPSVSPARTICVPDDHPGGDWPMMGGTLEQTRHQTAEREITRVHAASLEPAWTFDANEQTGTRNNEITGYPIVADGCVFVGTNAGRDIDGWVIALNADGGDVSWKRRVDGGIYSSLAVAGGRVFAFVSKIGAPYVAAFDQQTGAVLWQTTVDTQPGSDAVSSPIVFDGMVWVGVSGTAAEGDSQQRFDFRGTFVLLDAASGAILAPTPTPSIPDEDLAKGYAGGAIWSTVSIDPATKYGYVGSGNPFNYEEEHAHTNAVLKIDLDRARATFGRIVGSYKGDVEEYFPEVADNVECEEEDAVGAFLAGFECGRLDLDFGAAPQIFKNRFGRTLVGAGQKSGVYHTMDPGSMAGVWKQVIGVPSAVGGIVGTPAFDGTALYVPHSLGGYLAALDRTSGQHAWVSPTADGVHWGNPVTSANGVLYTVDLKGFLDAYDAGTGAPILHRPLALGARTHADPTFTWGGVTVARNTVYASVGVGLTSAGDMFPSMPNGFVIAYKPAIDLPK